MRPVSGDSLQCRPTSRNSRKRKSRTSGVRATFAATAAASGFDRRDQRRLLCHWRRARLPCTEPPTLYEAGRAAAVSVRQNYSRDALPFNRLPETDAFNSRLHYIMYMRALPHLFARCISAAAVDARISEPPFREPQNGNIDADGQYVGTAGAHICMLIKARF